MAASAAAQDCREILGRAQQAFEGGRFPEAAAELERARVECPGDRVRIEVSLGQTQYVLGKQREAEESFKAALALDPKNEEALYALGRVYAMLQRYPEAAERLEAAVRLNPKNYKAWDNLGVAYDALGRDADALRCFTRALDLVQKEHRDYDWAHANVADYFLRRDQNEQAFQFAAEAAQRNPASARDAFLTGKALVRLNKQELSLRWLERAVELDPQYADALYLLGQTYKKLGRNEDAAVILARFQEAAKSRTRR